MMQRPISLACRSAAALSLLLPALAIVLLMRPAGLFGKEK